MKCYPISVIRKSYRGSDARRRVKVQEYNRIAAKVEDHLNADLAKQADDSVTTYLTYHIAADVGEDREIVHDIVYSIDCGANGVTLYKGNYERAMANLMRG